MKWYLNHLKREETPSLPELFGFPGEEELPLTPKPFESPDDEDTPLTSDVTRPSDEEDTPLSSETLELPKVKEPPLAYEMLESPDEEETPLISAEFVEESGVGTVPEGFEEDASPFEEPVATASLEPEPLTFLTGRFEG